jgi:hypothetical protein
MKIKVANKEFKINMVNNYVHHCYSKFVDSSRFLTIKLKDRLAKANEKFNNDVENLRVKYRLNEEIEDHEFDREGFNKELKECKELFTYEVEKIDSIRAEKIEEMEEMKEEVIKELCIKNGYKFDKEWWLHETDPNMMNDFMLKCIGKDIIENENNSKKKL